MSTNRGARRWRVTPPRSSGERQRSFSNQDNARDTAKALAAAHGKEVELARVTGYGATFVALVQPDGTERVLRGSL